MIAILLAVGHFCCLQLLLGLQIGLGAVAARLPVCGLGVPSACFLALVLYICICVMYVCLLFIRIFVRT